MIDIQKAGIRDLEKLALLFDAYRQFYKQDPDLPAAREFLRERIICNESVIFMAVENGNAVGFTQLYPIFTSVGLKRAWLLNDLFVTGAARKKGIASALLHAAKEYGRSSGAGWLLLETASDNHAAQALYEKDGWERATDIFYQFSL